MAVIQALASSRKVSMKGNVVANMKMVYDILATSSAKMGKGATPATTNNEWSRATSMRNALGDIASALAPLPGMAALAMLSQR